MQGEKTTKITDTLEIVRLSILIALATVINIIESKFAIPLLPWLRIGLANVMTLIALTMYGIRGAMIVSCMKALLAGIFGSLPMLAFSLSASLTSSLVMGVTYIIFRKKFSIVGLSIIGAVIHNLTQLLVAFIILNLSRKSIFAILSFLIIAAILAGILTGFIARYLIKILNERRIWSKDQEV
ncbi:MAG: Gx transporter family protein [bacterium]